MAIEGEDKVVLGCAGLVASIVVFIIGVLGWGFIELISWITSK